MENAYIREFDALSAYSHTREWHKRTGYWFTVKNRSEAHTAFRTRAELDTWLTERGLTLASPLPEAGEGGASQIIGSYRRNLDRDRDRFESLDPILITTEMDNAELTPAKITEEDGIRTVHLMNVNYRPRGRPFTRESRCDTT